jgi:hypothetical protein
VSHADEFDRWHGRVQAAFADLKPHHRRALAEYSFGMALSRCCGLTSVVEYLAAVLAAGAWALEQRLREFYRPASAQKGSARSEFDHTLCFGPLVRWAASGHKERRLVLALDPTCLTDRFRVLCASVLYRGCGLPVAWAVQRAEDKGSWNGIWLELMGRLKSALGEGWTVLVLTDRGLESQALFRAIVSLGWHPLMRAKAGGKFRPEGWRKGHGMARFAPAVGRRFAAAGVAYPTGDRLPCTLLAAWEEGHAEPWLVLTDLPPGGANPAWYAWRMWAEQGFRAVKRGQWGWHRTQMHDAARAARLWAVIAVATLWMVEVGGEGDPPDLPEVPRRLSTLKTGLLRLFAALVLGTRVPVCQLAHHDWPAREWGSDPLTEDIMDQC